MIEHTEPVKLVPVPEHGRLQGSNGRYEKRLADLAGVYRDDQSFARLLAADDGNPVYWVESSDTQPGPGGLITGISTVEPGRIGDEFAMTRGHLHQRAECAETYIGLSGHGVMVLDAVDGESRVLALEPGEVVYVPGGWVHRSVNVGTERFSMLFVYSGIAGQNYGIIEQARGMKQLVVTDGTGWATRPNPDHVGYSGVS